jgi:carboxymethylenebutenolidase
MGKLIEIEGDWGVMPAWLSLPERPNGCGLVLGMSVWGLNADLQGWADLMADLGFAVLAPNLFWRSITKHAIEYDFSRLAEVGQIMNQQTDEQGLEDLERAALELRRITACSQTGIVGWCYGGRLACLCGVEQTFQAVVAFYPTALETRLDIATRLRAPLSLHLAEIEQYATRDDAIELVVAGFAAAPGAETFVYPGVTHGFAFSPPHPNFDAAAARLANIRAALFLHQNLECPPA